MDIQEIKHQNLLRLAKERNCDEPARLARVLGVKIQHASQLLLNKVGIGPKTIKKLCAAWGISENEFVTDPQNTTKGGSVTELSEDWQMKMIIEQIGKRIDDVVKVMSRFKDELQILQNSQISTNQAIDEINKSLISIKGRMLDAANSGNVEALGGDIVNE